MEILEKIEVIAADDFKRLASQADSNKLFPKEILDFFEPEELELIVHELSLKKMLSFEDRAKFFFYAGKYCANVRNYFLVSLGMVGGALTRFASRNQKKQYLKKIYRDKAICSLAISEPSVGSDISSIKTQYQIDTENYLINGKKKWITLGGLSDFFLLAANGIDGLQLFIVDAQTPGISVSEIDDLMCNRGSHICELTLHNVRVPRTNLLGEDVAVSSNALKQILLTGRCIAAVSSVAMAEAALDEAVLYAKRRLQFGKRIFEHQLIKKKLGDSKTAIAAGKALSVESFRTEFNGTGEAVNNAAMAKYFNSNVVERVTNDCLTAVGAISLTEELELSRYSREAKGFQFIEGTSEVLVQLIANGALMGYPKLWKQKDVE